ncbi:DUF4865 family protein, partial [Variovorax sp. E3]|uniref:DUF4865 family protein n=1 Tax=Variovorax sp. E3 TaxID=1914993 RepID=UPI0022B70829
MQAIRQRAARRGPLWDDTQGLVFKAFVSQERAQHGAAGHLYASVYLWHDPSAAARFLMGERFQGVIDSFGRPRVETWLPLDARAGAGRERQALSLRREERAIDATADRAALLAAETEANRQSAAQADTVAVWTTLDLANWRSVRFTLSARASKRSMAPRSTKCCTSRSRAWRNSHDATSPFGAVVGAPGQPVRGGRSALRRHGAAGGVGPPPPGGLTPPLRRGRTNRRGQGAQRAAC